MKAPLLDNNEGRFYVRSMHSPGFFENLINACRWRIRRAYWAVHGRRPKVVEQNDIHMGRLWEGYG